MNGPEAGIVGLEMGLIFSFIISFVFLIYITFDLRTNNINKTTSILNAHNIYYHVGHFKNILEYDIKYSNTYCELWIIYVTYIIKILSYI